MKDLTDVVRKARRDKAQMILFVFEDFGDQALWDIVKEYYFYEADAQLYRKKRDPEKQMAVKDCGTWAL